MNKLLLIIVLLLLFMQDYGHINHLSRIIKTIPVSPPIDQELTYRVIAEQERQYQVKVELIEEKFQIIINKVNKLTHYNPSYAKRINTSIKKYILFINESQFDFNKKWVIKILDDYIISVDEEINYAYRQPNNYRPKYFKFMRTWNKNLK